ncbi:MAG: malonyl-CoA decarboxylase [Magnetovibrio sp.]|nr:malonyl-CoA decarboxylase [Magnetovibrio sp.]
MTFFRTFLSSIADAGRELLDGRPGRGAKSADINTLCADLITQKGEALGTALACAVVDAYRDCDEDQKRTFFTTLLTDFDVNQQVLNEAIAAYQADANPTTAHDVAMAAESMRQRVIRGINMAPGGTRAVINMREDLLPLLQAEPGLKTVDSDFKHLLSSWFNRGFLELRRIDWSTPANILEKLIAYEAVHEIRDWDDLRRRLDSDRRCYAFFHPALPDEPLIFVEVALVSGLAGSVQELLDESIARIAPNDADTAIFYSISNCQKGLRGISFGNFLIKQVVAELRGELPGLKTFSTLSPLPGFGHWLQSMRGKSGSLDAVLDLIKEPDWQANPDLTDKVQMPLMQLCAHYLVHEKRRGGPLDGVARFHLGNGARLERINWLGDVSPKGVEESASLLVNYKYDLANIESNHEAFANDGKIVHSKQVGEQLAASAQFMAT